jgi:hypothetical protein
MILLYKFIVLVGMLVGMFLLGRKSRDNAFLEGYHLGRKVAAWRAPNIRFTGRALVPASRRVD